MGIALPPPVTPQLAPLSELQAQAQDQIQLEYRGVHLHVFGSKAVPAERLRAAVDAAATISEAVRAVGSLYYLAGFPATVLSYAPDGISDLYIRVVPGKLSEVKAPPRLMPYFSNLTGDAPLTDAEFEHDRALADGAAERAGEKYQPILVPSGGDTAVLDLGEAGDGIRQTGLAASFSNYGNRYAGPYLASAGVRQDFSTGDEILASGVVDARFLGLGGDRAEPYHEGDGGWSHITPFGVFGLEGRYADFQQDVDSVQLKGKYTYGAATWLYPLYSDFQHRLNLQARFERDHEAVQAPLIFNPTLLGQLLELLGLASLPTSGQAEVLSELYNSAGLDLSYAQRSTLGGDHVLELQANLAVRKGLGPAASALTPAKLDYLLWRPSFNLRYAVTHHWTAIGQGNMQFSGDSLPEQQQFIIGGPTSLHAYEAGAGAGDSGIDFRLAAEWKGSDDSWVEQHALRPRAFVEYGSSRLHRTVLGAPQGSVEAADAGVEADFHFTSWLQGTVSAAQSFYHQGQALSPDGLERKYVFFQLAAKY
jgi:hemolysin activation/secretion protein